VTQQIPCPKCGKIQSRKGKHQIVLRTLFGKLRLDSPRLYDCGCCSKEEYRSFSPLAELLTERTTPELAYLETKFAAMISYGLTPVRALIEEVSDRDHGKWKRGKKTMSSGREKLRIDIPC
jgi:hypothetical protein